MSQPDLLSERIEAFRASFFADARQPVRLEPDAIRLFDTLIADFVAEARALEGRVAALGERCTAAIAETAMSIERAEALRLQMVGERVGAPTGLPLARVIADLDGEAQATEAFAASIARTKDRIVQMRAAQEPKRMPEATEQAILDGVAAGRVTLFPIAPRPAFGPATQQLLGAVRGDVPVEDALDFIAAVTRDASKSRFACAADVSSGDRHDAPTFDTPEDCA